MDAWRKMISCNVYFCEMTHMRGKWGTPWNFLLPFTDEFWKTRKIRLLKKWKKLLKISSFYTCVPKNTIIWGTVPEIRSETEFFVILGYFLPCYPPPNNPENQNLEKMKKSSGNVIILNLCNKKHNQMMYAYSDMECHRHNCHFRPLFALLPNYWPWKLKIGKNVKKTWTYYPF